MVRRPHARPRRGEGRARLARRRRRSPSLLDDLDASLVGKDRLPWLKETGKIVGERSTNWAILPCPHPAWATLVYPDLSEDEAYEQLWSELEHVLRLDEPDPAARLGGADGDAERLGRAASPSAASTRSSCAARAPS